MADSEEKLEKKVDGYIIHEFEQAKITSPTGLVKDTQIVFGDQAQFVINTSELIKPASNYGLLHRFIQIGNDYFIHRSLGKIEIFKIEGKLTLSKNEYKFLKYFAKTIEQCKK
ncbi:MAG: hypothetical protein NT139_01765 [Candidatus Woesearchaeota archaeon]|nr:hypothetical protein [Candidatus Woesearchaeota archaeon]